MSPSNQQRNKLIYVDKKPTDFDHIAGKSQQDNKRITILLRDTPTVQHGYYWVQVGINSPVRYTPVYNFAVYPPQMTIGYINTLTDTVEPLAVWRKKSNQ